MKTLSIAALTLCFAFAPPAAAGRFVDVLDAPAQPSPLAAKSLMLAVTHAGKRLVAAGQRGLVVVSDDGGVSWKQATVPVSSDLTAAWFVDDKQGWAVGHDGVVIRTADGGSSWNLQLDGRKANALLVAAMKAKADAEPTSEEAKRLLTEAQRYDEQRADKPFLDVWFADANNGYVVGAYNMIFRTTDGGATWSPWFDRTDNPKFFNLYAIRPVGGDLYIAGEGGLVLKLDFAGQRFRALQLPYTGSLFGVTAAKTSVLVFGLRGNAFRSDDAGATWVKVDTALPASVVAAAQTAAGATLLADAGGRIVASEDGAHSFRKVTLKQSMPLTDLADAGERRLVVAGPRGVAVVEIESR